jgi:hypothetical protein
MNFFFFTSNEFVNSKLQIPKFNNGGHRDDSLNLFGAFVNKDSWEFYNVNCREDDNFNFLSSNADNQSHIFFYHSNLSPENFSGVLTKPSQFTHTSPAFRANLVIENNLGGFSSYQSEYPFAMTQIKSSMVSSAGNLIARDATNCGVFIRNISAKPSIDKHELFIWDEDKEEIIDKVSIFSNSTNFVCLNELVNNVQNIGLFCNTMVGIPIFVIEYENGSLSFEHTHPPHENVHGVDRFQLVKSYKEKISDKILKKSLAL